MGGWILDPAIRAGRRVAEQFRRGADTYAILRSTSTPDGAGGGTDVEGAAGGGECILTVGARLPEERVIADRAGSQVPMIVRDLPWDIILNAKDVLLINGSLRLEVLGVLQSGVANAAVTAVCEKVS
jgi:hypothetical protein